MKYLKSMIVCAAFSLLSFASCASVRVDDLFIRMGGEEHSAHASSSDATSANGVTKRRLGSLTRNDMVVTDVSGGGGGGGGCDTNVVISIVTNYDAQVVVKREGRIVGRSVTRPHRIGPYLWETGTDGEDFIAATNRFAKRYPSYGRCTGVCNSKYHGRNLDWTYDGGATVVVRSPATETRFGVLGVSSGVVTDAMLSSNAWDDAFYAIPFSLSDGINDHGVVIQQNVIQRDIMKSSEWHFKNENSIIVFAIIRYALDRSTNALAAAEIIRDRTFIPSEFAFDFHFQVSDSNSSYIVEDGVIYGTDSVPTDVMTNFRVGGMRVNPDGTVDWRTIETFGIGVERYDSVRTNGFDTCTIGGMVATMKSLWYTRAYETNTVPYWYTEHCSPDTPNLTVEAAMTKKHLFKDQVESWYRDYVEEHDRNSHRYRGGTTWQTVHMSVYDRDRLSLYLVTQEDSSSLSFFRLNDETEYTTVDEVNRIVEAGSTNTEARLSEIWCVLTNNCEYASNIWKTVDSYIPYFTDYATNNYKNARLANYRARRLEFWQESVSNRVAKLVVSEYTPWVVSTNSAGSLADPTVVPGAYVLYDNYRYEFFLPDGTTSIVEGVEGKTSISSLNVSNDSVKAYVDLYASREIVGQTNDLGLAYVDNIPRLSETYDFEGGSNFTYRMYTLLTNIVRVLGGSITNAPTFN